MSDAYIFDAVRTPRGRGKKDGALHEVRSTHLLVTVFHAIRERNQLDTSLVDDAILGCVTQVGDQGADVAKMAVIAAGYDQKVSGVTVNRFCGSGLEAVNMAAAKIKSGFSEMIVAGGVESMSRIPMGSDGGGMFTDPGMIIFHHLVPQGISADLIATKYGYTRKQLDEFAVESHRRAATAWQENRFAKSIVPIKDINGFTILDKDETIRPDTNTEALSTLKPSFEQMGALGGMDAVAIQRYPETENISHVHHAGNSSGIVDGAAAVLIGSKKMIKKCGLKPRARVVSVGLTGTEPTIMLLGPMPATMLALKKAKMIISDIDLFEVNEAFAAVPIRYMEELNIPPDKINVNGGAIAMGHPLGATGAMLLGTLLDELEREDKQIGVITLCIGGGMGIATVIERV